MTAVESIEGLARDLVRDQGFSPLERLLPLTGAVGAQFHACVARLGEQRMDVHAFLAWQRQDGADLARRAASLRRALELAGGFFSGQIAVTFFLTEIQPGEAEAAGEALRAVPEGHFLEKVQVGRVELYSEAERAARHSGRMMPDPGLAWFERHLAAAEHATPEEASAALAARENDESRARRFLQQPSKPWGTYALIGLNVLMFLKVSMAGEALYQALSAATPAPEAQAMLHAEAEQMARMEAGANMGSLVWGQKEYWRLLASMFLHGDILHLVMNMMALFSLGSLLERLAGFRSLLLLYFLAGLAGSLVSSWINVGPASVGSSGAIMGLAGALLALHWRRPAGLPKLLAERIYGSLVKPVAFIFVLGFALSLIPSRILFDNWCHLGGLAGGFGLAFLWPGLLQRGPRGRA